jgi:hypothetical protein
LPIEFAGSTIAIVSTHVEKLEEPITPKPIPLTILEIGIGAKVTLVKTITHAFEVFRTLHIIFKNTFVVERPKFEPIPLAELVDTTCEQHVDDLAT